MVSFVWVALGGAIGAIARYGVSMALPLEKGAGFPWATFAVNGLGCLAIGAFLGLGNERDWANEGTRLFLVTGVLGAFTTFSTFGFETVTLLQRGQSGTALAYVMASLLVAGAAVVLGAWSTRTFA